MRELLPIVLVPGLNCSPRLYGPQLAELWRFGPVTVADHTRDETMAGIAARILKEAPPRFALIGLSMGGYISLELMRQAPERVERVALLDTGSRADTPESSAVRRERITLAEGGRFDEVIEMTWPALVHPSRLNDAAIKQIHRDMSRDVGPQAYVRQQKALMGRPDSRPMLSAIRCPALVLVGEQDALTPVALSEEIAAGIPGARLVKVPDCGHLSTLECPEAVNRALVEWMAQ